ncbi:type III PLP-dependent enzyme domain-containing protein [Actinophytocola algeriensis]|uniref:Diaminopimelate decarboxylase n=1 Tax=Actinophytocola algeriensis TaxID=1768010 RepID=A0A7W7VFL2_9PSEU|nr:type III PLP-dependent enzyme [Actinophytocola algeriensis]MBB4908416.1 diaminopimelate decarboxylase [Actinophytocola algeriensis]MBE1475197.1 diaminopimelate decarboxylase [Actinophytocola algeriensis]
MTDLLSAVDEVGTPAYVYDLAEIRVSRQRLRAVLPGRTGLYYSLTANPHPELLREIRAGDVLPAVRSPGELDAALVAGWAARDVLYSGPARRDTDLDWALRLGVRTFTVDSEAALDQLSRRAAGHREPVDCLLRVNTSALARAGADPDFVLSQPAGFAGGGAARVVGLHVCTDSDVDSTAELAGRLVAALAGHGVVVERIGFTGAAPGLAERFMTRSQVSFEVDSELVGVAGTLVTAVLDVRVAAGQQVVVLESGANHAGLFAGRRRRSLSPRLVSRAPRGGLVDTVLFGPQEIPLDVWAPSVRLPRLRPGDVLAVPDTGAWGVTAGLVAFGAPDMPAEVVIDRDDPDADVVHVSRLSVTRYP